MRDLILIKHSHVAVDPNVPANRWRLSPEGRRRCTALAQRLNQYNVGQIVSSVEPKAAETARLVAEQILVPWRTVPGLHEHDRSNEPFRTPQQFHDLIAAFFARPREQIFGTETANAARDRFARAVEQILAPYPTGNLAIVAHGTVVSLFVAMHNRIDPFVLWQQLEMPSFVVLRLPDLTIHDVAASAALPPNVP